MNTLADRIAALAATRGIKTKAATLRGAMRALRGSKTASRAPWAPKPAYLTRSTASAQIGLGVLLRPYDQGRARTRLIDEHAHLLAAITAAVGGGAISSIGAVPNAYRGQAEESAASAMRRGDAVLVCWGRYSMPHRPHGSGSAEVVPSRAKFVRRNEVMDAIRLPAGYRWSSDSYGAMILGPDLADGYHPTAGECLAAITAGSFAQIIATARAAASIRAAKLAEKAESARDARRVRLLARLGTHIVVSRADSVAAGNCQRGTDAWCKSVGIADTVQALPVRDVFRLGTQSGERRAVAVALLAARRALI